MPNIGLPEILIVLVIALIVFGPKRLPEMGRSLGRGIREFKDSITGNDEDDEPREIERVRPDESATPLEGEVVHERKS
jgi:sec-independent protein translocase protein TatA